MKIPEKLEIFSKLFFDSFQTPLYIVGGFVRDNIIGIENKDIDLCSSITPDILKDFLIQNRINFYAPGEKFGTVIIRFQGLEFEHTTLRCDIKTDGRHAKVEYTNSLEEDSKRRDLTVNAIYYDIQNKKLLDPQNGVRDLKDQKARFIGDTKKRIQEDYLRIPRYFRFSDLYDLKRDEKDVNIIKENSSGYECVSVERSVNEILTWLKKGVKDYKTFLEMVTLLSPVDRFCKYLKLLYDTRQNHPMHDRENVLFHTLDLIDHFNNNYKNREDREYYILLFHDYYKPYTITTDEDDITHFYGHDNPNSRVEKELKKLRIPKATISDIRFFIKAHLRINMYINGNITKKNDIFPIIYDMYDMAGKHFLNTFKRLRRLFEVETSIKGNKVMTLEDLENEIQLFLGILKEIDIKKIAQNTHERSLIRSSIRKALKTRFISL